MDCIILHLNFSSTDFVSVARFRARIRILTTANVLQRCRYSESGLSEGYGLGCFFNVLDSLLSALSKIMLINV